MALSLVISPSALADERGGDNIKAKERYRETRKEYSDSVDKSRDEQERLHDYQYEYVRASSTVARDNLNTQIRAYLSHTVNALLKRMESVQVWVNAQDDMSEDDKAAILADVNVDIAWLQDQLTDLETVSTDELNSRTQAIKAYWQRHKYVFVRVNGRILVARLQFVLNKAEVFSGRVGDKINELATQGFDVKALQFLHTEYDRHLAAAQAELDLAVDSFNAIDDADDAAESYRQGLGHVKAANRYIHEAFLTLREIILSMQRLASPDSYD